MRKILTILFFCLSALLMQAQITIGGSVYGGGNEGKVGGSTTVTVRAGDLHKVFGGARMADVGGSAFVNIDGEHASGYILIDYVYGGNDISGTIGTSETLPAGLETEELTEYKVDNTWNAFVHISRSTKTVTTGEGEGATSETVDDQKIYIGQLFAGGNGDYTYGSTSTTTGEGDEAVTTTTYTVTDKKTGEEIETSSSEFLKPDLAKTYLQLHGGSIVYAYGGGNNATVTEKTVICLNNPSTVVNEIKVDDNGEYDENGTDAITKDNRTQNKMDLNPTYSYPSSDKYQIGSFFGGNNTAEMKIRPEWHLKKGKIRNLYSGGNRGTMTSPDGLLLVIDPASDDDLEIENVYGGCRMADVRPQVNGVDTPTQNLAGYHFPDEFSARLLVKGGKITNVYGGNDITGKVYGGNAVGVYTSIEGDIYGGGNGSYPYTDNGNLTPAAKQIYEDFIYDPNEKDEDGNSIFASSLDALNAYRPNAEQVSIRVWGPSENDPTIIRGSIYCGGNSATLKPKDGKTNPTVELKIGSHVIAQNVFLGNNGENMVKTNEEEGDNYIHEGVLRTMRRTDLTNDGSKFCSLDLTDEATFASYMNGAAMDIMPSVVFDKKNDDGTGDPETYQDYTSYFGSFYCGGNVGSITKAGCEAINFNYKVVIFEKLVGGCNNAIVDAQYDESNNQYNARYEGGLIGDPEASTGNKMMLNLSGLKIEPRRWKTTPDNKTFPDNYLEWNTFLNGNTVDPVTEIVYDNEQDENGQVVTDDEGHPVKLNYQRSTDDDLARRFEGGNIFGGCYTSGIVRGNVVINVDATLVEREKLFDEVESDELGEEVSLYGTDQTTETTYHITKRNTGVILGQQGMDVLGRALSVFGGGKGSGTEVWGNTTINLNKGYTFQVFGGSAEGVIGKPDDGDGNPYSFNSKTFKYNPNYSCYVNLRGNHAGVSKKADSSEDMAEAEFIYGGGFEGPICGNTVINLGKGRIFNSFAGSCNADILGHTETYIGRQVQDDYKNDLGSHVDSDNTYAEGFPWIRDIVYGGNDLGGEILRTEDFSGRVSDFASTKVYTSTSAEAAALTTASSYVEYLQGRADAIFGGCYGTYDYTDEKYSAYTYTKGEDGIPSGKTAGDPREGSGFKKPYMPNAFVNFCPTYTNDNNVVKKVYGAGQGYPEDRTGDKLQDHSYVLIDIPEGIGNFANMEVFGAGAYNGLGMRFTAEGTFAEEFDLNEASAVIDLMRGQVGAAYGGSYAEGITRRTLVNVPEGSTIKIGSIFGGAYGSDDYLLPCDVYEANVNYLTKSEDAYLIWNPERTDQDDNTIGNKLMKGAIYGGNNNSRRTLYGKINISAPVRQKHPTYGMTTATIYGAGCGSLTWSEYTEVNLNADASVWEVYGGAEAGSVMSAESVQKYISINPNNVDPTKWQAAWTLGSGYDPTSLAEGYANNQYTNLSNQLVRTAEMDDRENKIYRYNTNVIINKDAYVGNYAYGGGLGKEGDAFVGSGDIYGTTYIALLGGTVKKDLYAAGTLGAVYNLFGAENYTVSSNAYIAGGTVRNVYGGGWKGDVGYTTMTVDDEGETATFDDANEKPGEAHVVIGIREDQTDKPTDYGFYNGVPAIQRNAYGGGEGGAIFGQAYLTLNNGYVGYEYKDGTYQEKIDDDTYYVNNEYAGDNRLKDCGNMFGGGYDVRSSVDVTNVTMWGGIVRNSIHGGGEIATIGRGAIEASGPLNSVRKLKGIYKPGKTNVEMFNGHVLRNVFGGGKGYNTFGYGQQGTLYMDGYVFGQTEVHVHGGEIGTDEGLADGYGNVFGGGDVGYVYSSSVYSDKTKAKTSTGSPGHIYYYNSAGNLTEDCKVVVAPYLQVKNTPVVYAGQTYNKYDYVPTDYLNTLPKKDSDGNYTGGWENLFTGDADGEEERGIYIHNAVFAGGNVSSNSDQTYANATTVYGNTTATLYDVYHRDFITVGTEHTGGLYGGGNLSVVDGYRELNITNYGTDYYGLKQTISIDEYRGLSNRERAYFQLEYKCIAASETNAAGKTGITIDGVFYETGERLEEEKYLKLLNNEDEAIAQRVKDSFEPYGFCSIYAGRLLNTIQRADLCGVFGSRMVLQGAKDRVAEVGEDIDYTINRVGELSLNQQHSVRLADEGTDATHGNYFGIYSLVNYLGNLTSDVRFGNSYVNGNGVTDTEKTYYSYKSANPTSSDRNKGQSSNQVALASGVFLELTTENSTKEKKDYGYVTGVIELDLINVKKDDVGGGFVYAKNEHRVPKYYPNKSNVILSEYNNPKTVGDIELRDEARTYKRYYYTNENLPTGDEAEGATVISGDDSHVFQTMAWQTSGNFIHPSKRIVDDCYPTNNAYIIGSDNYSEAHYWYVKGEVYIYDQKVSAYTGSANAYSKEVHLPLTITAASHGKLQLLNVKPNLYAYKTDKDGQTVKIGTAGSDGKPIDKVWVNNESDSYGLNDVISWWDWHQLSAKDRQYFVTQTYVNCVTCIVDGVEYEQGTYVMDQNDYDHFMGEPHVISDSQGETFQDDGGHDIGKTFVFRSSNNISHENGYVLTFDMNSPKVWDDYFSPVSGSSATGKMMKSDYQALFTDGLSDAQKQAIIDAWREGPTFTPTETGVYGKRSYNVGEIITEATYLDAGEGQDKMERAYVAIESVTYSYNGTMKTVNSGTAISLTEFNSIGTSQSSFREAFFCTNSVKLTNENYMLYGELKTADEIAAMKAIEGKSATDDEIDAALTPAYICTQDGEYGGQRFETGKNYGAIQAWSSLPEADRTKFNYNFDALDLLTNTDYLKVYPDVITSPATETTVAAFHSPYTDQVKVEYQAVFKKDGVDVKFNGANLDDGAILTNEQFETIRNDKRHYTHVETRNNGDNVYIAKENFIYLGTPYGIGQVVDADVYRANTQYVEVVVFETAGEWYYCYEDYKDENGQTVAKGTQITKADYGNVPNYQQYFIIQGQEPTETTTLYVSRESNAYDVLKEKIITVVYQYTYYEDEDDGSVKMTNELHVINVHLDLESGVPQIGTLNPPATVLPGNAIGLKAPDVNPGLYEVLTSGWELYATHDDAYNHRNGMDFENNKTPLYWYQNQKNYVAFYSKTYLGKTYSNPVPLSVANYHDLDAVMQDKEHHLYVDRSDVDRPSKIYIDNRQCKSDETKNELDLLKDFYDLSVLNSSSTGVADGKVTAEGALNGHALLGNHVYAGNNLEFFLNSDVSPKATYTVDENTATWSSIGSGSNDPCFSGTLHGDGHTISGLDHSLFDKLCGEVYNLGVTGSFTGAGVAETGEGYVENCWVTTTGTPTQGEGHYAVFGNPSRESGDERGPIQVVNCYYPESNAYTEPTSTIHGQATQMPDKAFYNGTVAYNLNGFYLKKRYYDNTTWTGDKTSYNYLPLAADGSLAETMSTAWYPNTYALYQPKGTEEAPYLGYVESRFYDGDFVYANGTIPESTNVRLRTVTVGEGEDATTKTYYTPIWPDDYLFFGQTLTYGHVDGRTHQATPSAISRSNERVVTSADGNRVYRAPAYYQNGTMGVAHFNSNAVFAQTKKNDASVTAYQNMTAIDFTGYHDDGYQYGSVTASGSFFPPLLDDDGLTRFQNVDLTRNLLVYTGTSTAAAQKTGNTVSAYLPDGTYQETNSTYHTVAVWDRYADAIRGHWVQLQEGQYVAPRDHLLVDKADFNCPISYTFADGKRMWYQREPSNYAGQKTVTTEESGTTTTTVVFDSRAGWEGISLPFSAELVTTQDKGEITHFYKGSTTGHEYWLRTYEGGTLSETVFEAAFNPLDAGANTKDYTNTFLWDYYYSKDDYQDKNKDQYQQDYYSSDYLQSRYPVTDYPYGDAGMPYLIGFPGNRYYEFDLSGEWTPDYRLLDKTIEHPGKQVITFASAEGITIGVSDNEMGGVSNDGYTFKPNYLNKEMTDTYMLNDEGSSFMKQAAATAAVPFRPYFVLASAGAKKRAAEQIVFNTVDSSFDHEEEADPTEGESGRLTITGKKHTIIVSSLLQKEVPVRIVSVSGITIATFTIQPGETIETHVPIAGVYIVNRTKISVK
ncbi:MAG: hypothetical protein IJP82_11150 [Bacteroidaceae bacterium]|nr:hypothetical protein [Bacteroidaceae bacterium]